MHWLVLFRLSTMLAAYMRGPREILGRLLARLASMPPHSWVPVLGVLLARLLAVWVALLLVLAPLPPALLERLPWVARGTQPVMVLFVPLTELLEEPAPARWKTSNSVVWHLKPRARTSWYLRQTVTCRPAPAEKVACR